MAKQDIIFQELGESERALLLRAYDHDVDDEGFVLNPSGKRIKSEGIPNRYIKANFAALVPGSLKVIDGTPTSISEYLRKRDEENNNGCS